MWDDMKSDDFLSWLQDAKVELIDRDGLVGNADAIRALNGFVELMIAKMVTEQFNRQEEKTHA